MLPRERRWVRQREDEGVVMHSMRACTLVWKECLQNKRRRGSWDAWRFTPSPAVSSSTLTGRRMTKTASGMETSLQSCRSSSPLCAEVWEQKERAEGTSALMCRQKSRERERERGKLAIPPSLKLARLPLSPRCSGGRHGQHPGPCGCGNAAAAEGSRAQRWWPSCV